MEPDLESTSRPGDVLELPPRADHGLHDPGTDRGGSFGKFHVVASALESDSHSHTGESESRTIEIATETLSAPKELVISSNSFSKDALATNLSTSAATWVPLCGANPALDAIGKDAINERVEEEGEDQSIEVEDRPVSPSKISFAPDAAVPKPKNRKKTKRSRSTAKQDAHLQKVLASQLATEPGHLATKLVEVTDFEPQDVSADPAAGRGIEEKKPTEDAEHTVDATAGSVPTTDVTSNATPVNEEERVKQVPGAFPVGQRREDGSIQLSQVESQSGEGATDTEANQTEELRHEASKAATKSMEEPAHDDKVVSQHLLDSSPDAVDKDATGVIEEIVDSLEEGVEESAIDGSGSNEVSNAAPNIAHTKVPILVENVGPGDSVSIETLAEEDQTLSTEDIAPALVEDSGGDKVETPANNTAVSSQSSIGTALDLDVGTATFEEKLQDLPTKRSEEAAEPVESEHGIPGPAATSRDPGAIDIAEGSSSPSPIWNSEEEKNKGTTSPRKSSTHKVSRRQPLKGHQGYKDDFVRKHRRLRSLEVVHPGLPPESVYISSSVAVSSRGFVRESKRRSKTDINKKTMSVREDEVPTEFVRPKRHSRHDSGTAEADIGGDHSKKSRGEKRGHRHHSRGMANLKAGEQIEIRSSRRKSVPGATPVEQRRGPQSSRSDNRKFPRATFPRLNFVKAILESIQHL